MFFLSIAASDSSGSAGIQQDLKMAERTGFWGLNAVTAVTSQSFWEADFIEIVSEKIFFSQLKIIFNSFKISAIKIGVLPKKRFASILLEFLDTVNCPIVYDPVFKTSSGLELYEEDPKDIFNIISPKCTVITPNIPEFEYFFPDLASYFVSKEYILTDNDWTEWILSKQETGGDYPAIYLKGGHSNEKKIIEYLYHKQSITKFEYDRKKWKYSRGTGCSFSSLLSMYLVNNDLKTACRLANETLVRYYEDIELKDWI